MAGRHLHEDDPPCAEAAERRRRAIAAGHDGQPDTARTLLDDPEPTVRAAALGALARLGELGTADAAAAHADASPDVRRRVLEVTAGTVGADLGLDPGALLNDPDPLVVEAACWAAGERPDDGDRTVEALARLATGHGDALCREAAVAALGALGHPDGLPAVLDGLDDRPTVRRRAVLALAPYEDPEVEAALERSLADRDWQVRQAAEDLLAARSPTGDGTGPT